MRCRTTCPSAAIARATASSHPLPRRPVWAWFTLLCLCASPAAADCEHLLEDHIRRATIDTVQRVLHTLDDDGRRYRLAYGADVMRHRVTAIGGTAASPRKLCVSGAGPRDASEDVFGAAGQAGFGGWRLRALALAPSLKADSWAPETERPVHGQYAFGAFIGHTDWLELGLVRFGPGEASALSGPGWMLSAASHGVRLAFVLDEQRFEDVDIGVRPIPLGPLAIGGGARWLRIDDVYTAYAAVTDIILTGTWEGGVFVDTRAELELDTGRLRSAEATLRLTFDTAPAAHLPAEQQMSGRPVDVIRLHTDLRVVGSVFNGSHRAHGPLPGFGMAWEVGFYGRNAGFAVNAVGWANDPSVLDYASDVDFAARFEVMARLVVGGGARGADR